MLDNLKKCNDLKIEFMKCFILNEGKVQHCQNLKQMYEECINKKYQTIPKYSFVKVRL